MATANILPIYTRLTQKILGKAGSRRETGDAKILEGLKLFWLELSCPTHAWSWPRTNQEERFEGFDAHQTCHKCTSRRLFDTREWHAGPIYKLRQQTDGVSFKPLCWSRRTVEQPGDAMGAV
ncbi:MAG: hypothetical protein WB561_19570 [Terracidiphilus sp.]